MFLSHHFSSIRFFLHRITHFDGCIDGSSIYSFLKTFLIAILFLLSSPFARADHSTTELALEQKKLIKLNLSDLLNLQVTSVSKKPQKVAKSAAAIFVITHQDIKNSGVSSIPEALRMAPGIDVAKIDGNKWAISARGFNGRFANKLLVLIDGRSVYTPFFSGVNWDVQDTLLEDIDRIEVIRGPGATLWGANAVNGVINIITKKADQTHGGYAMAGGGSHERVFGGGRYGGKINDSTHYRVYGKYFERESNKDLNGQDANDEWQMERGGFRVDMAASKTDNITVQGDIYKGLLQYTVNEMQFTAPYNTVVNTDDKVAGGNILLRWNKQLAENESTTLQVYYDLTDNNYIDLHQTHHTFDIDFQHALPFTKNQNLVWGTGYRFISSTNRGSFALNPDLKREDSHLFSLFVQDEITLIDDELVFTLGSKFEHNEYSGFEIQPSARLIWTPTSQQSIWASVSRAVRTPAQADQGGVINQQIIPPSTTVPLPTVISLTGSMGRASEKLIAYELGYRIKLFESLSVDLAAFYNVYDNLINLEPGTPFLDGSHIVQPIFLHTDMSGETYGAEIALSWHVMDKLSINANYSYLQMQLHAENGDSNLSENAEKQSPHHKFSVLSTLNVLPNLDWNLWFRYVDSVPDYQVPSYFTIDTRLAWRPIQSIELSVVGQNLLDKQHPEFGNDITLSRSSQVERSVYGKVEWNF